MAAVTAVATVTEKGGVMDVGTSETRPGSSSPQPLDVQGFAPGTILAARYRIVALVGRGGMGEVYRADDLRLGQTVALKFLPETLERDPAARDRLLAEVRSARTVSHPNVCRVYDAGEITGSGELRRRTFLTMEYIDGEDLASLLRRIGRLPAPKALDIARQLCAGLAAAHDKGVLHRDLKPANVMIDGRGQARITDFGLAVETGQDASPADYAGTVAYMAPERFSGKPATVQTDLYALGLVLYETYTGRAPFKATTVGEWQRAHSDSAPGTLAGELCWKAQAAIVPSASPRTVRHYSAGHRRPGARFSCADADNLPPQFSIRPRGRSAVSAQPFIPSPRATAIAIAGLAS
jgi:serine/threonine-protein kinase